MNGMSRAGRGQLDRQGGMLGVKMGSLLAPGLLALVLLGAGPAAEAQDPSELAQTIASRDRVRVALAKDDFFDASSGEVALITAAAAAAGALVGAGIGALAKSWRTVYPRS